jgi:endonuclease/exonuclease/phosphatase (EEP) superfamily protein YafD
MFGAALWLAAGFAIVIAAAGIALQLSLRDDSPLLAPFYYALPWPMAGALLVFAALVGTRAQRLPCLVAGGAALGWWFFQSFGWASPETGKWKAITWNLGRPRHPFAPLVKLVRAERPDLVTLVETGSLDARDAMAYERLLPGYHLMPLGGGLACLARGHVIAGNLIHLSNGSDTARMRVRLGGEWMNVFIVDIDASPWLSRRKALRELLTLSAAQPRTLVLGDFNTPLGSAHLDDFRARLHSAMGGRHRGFRETWPFNLPLLSLDQIWLSRDLAPVFTSRRTTFASDHAPVVATFSPAAGQAR